MSLYIATLAEAKADLGLADTKDDALLTRHMEGMQGRFDDYANRRFSHAAAETEYFDGGGRSLSLRRYPVESVASVVLDPDREWTDPQDVLVEDEDFVVVADDGRLLFAGDAGWPRGRQHLRVVYAGGYIAAGETPAAGQTAMPEALRRAMLLQIGYEWRNRLNLGRASMSAQGGNVQLSPAKLLPEVAEILDRYTRF